LSEVAGLVRQGRVTCRTVLHATANRFLLTANAPLALSNPQEADARRASSIRCP
jgi:hypothetical protein